MHPGCRAAASLRYARACRGSLNARPCAYNELARIVRAILRTFPARPRRGKRGPEDQKRPLPPFGHLPPRYAQGKIGLLLSALAFGSCLPPLIFLPLHRTEHRRRRRGKGAHVRAQGCASSRRPAGAEKRRALSRSESAVSGRVSFGNFSLHEQRKVTRSSAGRVEALASKPTKAKAKTG